MRWTRSLSFALVAIVGVALIATGYGVAQLTSVETEVRVVARPHEDGRVEFAVQQRVDSEWGERIAPSSRYLTPRLIEERVGRWLNSSPITLTVAVGSDEITETTDEGQAEPASSPNRPPIANAGPDSAYDLRLVQIALDGNGSHDPDSDSLTYEWTQTTGPTVVLRSPRSASPWFESPRAEQTLTFQLRVADEDGATSTDTVTVQFANARPTAEAGASQQVGRGQQVVLHGSGSDDGPGDDLTYRWSQVSGSPVKLSHVAVVSLTFTAPDEPDQLVFSLTVSDGQLESNPDTVAVTVRNTSPVADAGADQYVSRGKKVTLRGSGSDDGQEGDLTYKWSQVSGPPVTLSDATAAAPTFTAPNEPDQVVFSLTVSDGQLESGPDTVTVTVNNTQPIADAGSRQEVSGGARVTLNGGASTDPDGDRLTYWWTQTHGDEVRLVNPATVRPHFTAPRNGQTLIFQIEVSDGHHRSVNAVQIIVADAPITISGSGDDAQTMAGMTRGVYFCDVELIGGNTNRYTSSSHFSVWMHGRDGGSELVVNEIVYVSPWSVRRRVVVGSGWRDLRGAVDAVINSEGRWTITCTRQ